MEWKNSKSSISFDETILGLPVNENVGKNVDFFKKCCQCCLGSERVGISSVKCVTPKSNFYLLNRLPDSEPCDEFDPNVK